MLRFRKILVTKKFMYKKEGENSRFSFDFFCLTVPKKNVGEPFMVSLISGSKNFMLKRVMSRLFVELFCLAAPKLFVEEPFYAMFQKISGSEKVSG